MPPSFIIPLKPETNPRPFQETIAAGKPIIMIPLFGDQPKNAKIGEKHGIARILQKSEVTEEHLYEAIREIISNPR